MLRNRSRLSPAIQNIFGTVMVWAGVRGAEVIGEMQKAQQLSEARLKMLGSRAGGVWFEVVCDVRI